MMKRKVTAILAALALVAAAFGTARWALDAPDPVVEAQNQQPASSEPLSALAPANIAKARPPAPFNVTGNWFIDVSANPEAWRFGPPYPKLTPAAQMHADASRKAT